MIVDRLNKYEAVPKPPEPKSEECIMSEWQAELSLPVLSICCIVYNHASFIEDALNGFLCQKTKFPFEIIVHDDASTDGSQKIVEKYQKKYPNIIKTIFQDENQYSKGRRALGFFQGVSSARYLAVCEGDDYWTDPYKLQKQVEYLDTHPECVITGHDAFIIDDAGTINSPSKLPDSQKRDYSARELAEGKAWILTMSWVYRNVVPEFAPERNMVRNGDNFFTSILGQYGCSHFHKDIQPAAYRVHAGGVWSSAGAVQKFDDQTNTWFWMYRYYQRVGQDDLAKIYYQRVKANIYQRSSTLELFRAFLSKVTGWKYVKQSIRRVLGADNVQKVKVIMRKARV